MSEPATAAGSVVVGVDGSDASKAALRWAVEQARLTGSSVDAVIAWHEMGTYAWPVPASDLDFEGTARAVVDQTLADVLGDEPPVPVRGHVVQGHPARVLIDAARDARLLVVGNRGHAGFTEALLGSVGQYCVHHAGCPVVVVRAAAR